MDMWVSLLSVAGSVITAMGGFEFVKWLFTRNSNARLANAQATSEEIEARADEYHLLRERLEVADRQLIEKETRFMEQTELVRSLNRQLIEKATTIGLLQAEVAELKAERAMKLCERRGCKRREPQSGY